MVWVVRCEEQSTWAPAGQNEGDVGLNGELHSLELFVFNALDL